MRRMSKELIGWNLLLIAVYLEMTWPDVLTANSTGPWFGDNCTFLCQCTGAVQCDLTTGECPPNVTCAAGTFGPSCKFSRNVAVKQKANQSSFFAPIYFPAHLRDSGKAVDGSKNFDMISLSCIQTNDIPGDAFWSLEYKWPQAIAHVLIYNQKDVPADLSGFFMELHDMRFANNTEVFSYKDNPTQIKAVYDIPMTLSIKQVTFVKIGMVERSKTDLSRNVLTLCEVETYGETICPKGIFGVDCQGTCQCGPKERCHPVTGLCAAPCLTKTSGQKCSYPCHPNCLNQRCQEPGCVFCVASDCLRCKPGFLGTYCDKGCPKGKQGDNCTLSCSKNCSGSTCNATNGHCFSCAGNQAMPLCTQDQDTSGSDKFEEFTVYYLILLILLIPLAILLFCCFLKRKFHPAVAEMLPEAKSGQ